MKVFDDGRIPPKEIDDILEILAEGFESNDGTISTKDVAKAIRASSKCFQKTYRVVVSDVHIGFVDIQSDSEEDALVKYEVDNRYEDIIWNESYTADVKIDNDFEFLTHQQVWIRQAFDEALGVTEKPDVSDNPKQTQGVCPKCRFLGLDYGDSYQDDDYFVYYWSCPNCGSEGQEFNKIVFDSYEIKEEIK